MAGKELPRPKVQAKPSSAAAIRTRIAAGELLDVKLFRGQCGLCGALLCVERAQVALVGGIAAPFAYPAPNESREALYVFRRHLHQSSPCATPEKPSAHCVGTYGDSWRSGWRWLLRMPYHCTSASTMSTITISARIAVTAASKRWLKMSRWVSTSLAAGIFPVAICAVRAFANARKPMRGLASKIF